MTNHSEYNLPKDSITSGNLLVHDYLCKIGTSLANFDDCLNETAIEKELFATENETPSMDLLTCSSAMTNANATQRTWARTKLESSSGTWTCTGKYKPAIGLGPLANLFSCLQESESPLLSAFEPPSKNLTQPQCYVPENDARTQRAPLYHNAPSKSVYAPIAPQPQPAYHNGGDPAYGTYHCNAMCIEHRTKVNPTQAYPSELPLPNGANYEVEPYYAYNQADFGYLGSFGLNGNQTCLYSPDEWYNANNENFKFTDNMDVRVNGYVSNEYSLTQSATPYY